MTNTELEKLGNIWINNLNAIGIYPNIITTWKINTRAKSRYGRCSKRNGYYIIEICSDLLNANCPTKALDSTIVHELLHAVDGCMNHGEKWKELADLVNDCYNVTVKRTSTIEEKYGKEYAHTLITQQQSKLKLYSCECSTCGKIYKQKGYRKPQWIAHNERFYCTPCRKNGKSGKLINIKISAINN